MELRITIAHIFIMIILFVATVRAQNNPELNVITINLEKENLIGMKDVELKNLLNSKYANDWNIIMSMFNNEFLIPVRIMIYKEERLIYVTVCYNREKINDEINVIVHKLNLF